MKESFIERNRKMVLAMNADKNLTALTSKWLRRAVKYEYSYHFNWMGRPVIQYPQDLVVMQEIIWDTKPDVIIELGVARGGSIIFYASMLELLGKNGRVVGVDIDFRPHNKRAILSHPMKKRINLVVGSSVENETRDQVFTQVSKNQKVLLILDSFHTREHVLKELNLYSPLVCSGCFIVVFDTILGYMPKSFSPNRPWGPGNSPKEAVEQFLATNTRFEVDTHYENKLKITSCPGGFLKCTRNIQKSD